MTDDLLEAVDDLTLPRNIRVETDDGPRWATEDALFVQLAAAVTSTLNSGSGSGGLPNTRNVLDSAALEAAARITSTVGDWCRIVKAPVTRDPSTDLRAWVARFDRDESDAFYLTQCRKWAAQIRSMTNPPKTLEVTAPCPACAATTYTNDHGDTVPNPVTVTYRPQRNIWADARATCRACEKTWSGEWELRALRHDVDNEAPNLTNRSQS